MGKKLKKKTTDAETLGINTLERKTQHVYEFASA